MNFLIIHGSFGSKDGNWFPWLKQELEKLGHKVYLPQFPVGEDKQSLESWTKTIEELNILFDENLIIVAHSIGPSFSLSLLETKKAKACFFISGFAEFYELIPEYDKVNKTFVDRKFDWNKIKQNCSKFVLYHANDDPYVALKYAENLANNLEVKLKIIKNGGHLNEEFGYIKFQELLDDIKKMIE